MTPRRAARTSGTRTTAVAPSRIGSSLLMVLPLLLAYEVSVQLLAPPVRNGAEHVVRELLGGLSPVVLDALRLGVLLVLLVTCVACLRERQPESLPFARTLIEAWVAALLLGPLVGWLLGQVGLSAPSAPLTGPAPPWLPFLLSVGAGLWEELVFRLAILGGLMALLMRVARWPPASAFAVALLASSLCFALYHHVGAAGEPLVADRFAFRMIAGTILGLLFAWRGLAVVVYMHVFYDLLCDTRALLA